MIFHVYAGSSSRVSTPSSLRKKSGYRDDEENLMKDLPEPVAVPAVEEVSVPKHVCLSLL